MCVSVCAQVTRNEWSNCGLSLLIPTGLRSLYYISSIGWLLLVQDIPVSVTLIVFTNLAVCGLMVVRVKQVTALIFEMLREHRRRIGRYQRRDEGKQVPITFYMLLLSRAR